MITIHQPDWLWGTPATFSRLYCPALTMQGSSRPANAAVPLPWVPAQNFSLPQQY